MNHSRLFVLLGLIVSVSVFRLLPHAPNFTPVIAVAIFAGAQFADRRMALLVPLLAMLVADLFLGLHATLVFVYGALALIVLLGGWLRRKLTAGRALLGAVSGSVLFFVISNFGAWLTMPQLYARSLDGLITAYVAAIPFYQNSLAATLLFGSVLFGGFYALERSFPKLAEPAV